MEEKMKDLCVGIEKAVELIKPSTILVNELYSMTSNTTEHLSG